MTDLNGRWFLPAFLALAPFLHPFDHANASSQTPGEEFRGQVENACRVAAASGIEVKAVRTDPEGTAHYGTAIVVDEAGGEHVCVYDKVRKTAEIGGVVPAAGLGPTFSLSGADTTQVDGLVGRIHHTLDDIENGAWTPGGRVETVLAILEKRVPGDKIADYPAGDYRCTVWYYGFLDSAERKVGTHQCHVTRNETGLTITKTTGERLNAKTFSWKHGMTAFAGRSYLDGQSQTEYDPQNPDNTDNANFGNKVGLAVRSDERLFLISADEHGFQSPDDTFFEIIELVPSL